MISMFNTGYDLQNQLDGVKNGIAIVSTGDTHIAITSGQYVYIQDHGTLAEGLYKATSNIAANGTLSSSNVTAVSGGGLNALNSNLNKLTVANYTSQIDLNNITETGMVYTGSDALNKPDSWCIVYTFVYNSSNAAQIAMRVASADMYYRNKTGGTWDTWKRIKLESI